MHPQLLAIMQAPLPASAKTLWSHLYAYTNGTLNIAVPLAGLLEDLGVAESTLRRNRAILAAAGALESWYAAGEDGATVLHCELRSPTARAVGEREAPDSAHLLRAEPAPEAPRAPTARALGDREAPVTPVTPAQRAVGARAVGARRERDDAQNAKPALYGISLKAGRQEVNNLPPDLGGGVGEPDAPDRGRALLAACGIDDATAAELAGGRPFEHLVRHVARWQADLAAGKVNGAGALLYRVAHGSPGKLPLTAAQLTAGLLAEHVTAADLAEWGVTPVDSSYVPAGFEHIIQH